MNKTMTLNEFKDQVEDGKIFGVVFYKKYSKQIREMTARRGVLRDTKGVIPFEERAAEDTRYDLLTVFDMQKEESGQDKLGAHRRINLADLVSVTLHKQKWIWDNDKHLFILEKC